jgi:PTH1 family peptidyl-tRNA hydrolase
MTWLIVGLGNPGPHYESTRHNVGAMVVRRMAEESSARLSRHRRVPALTAETRIGNPGSSVQSVLMQPESFMNESGGPVKAAMRAYDVEPDHLIVVHDELDIAFARLRIKHGGGDGGHNGLRSIRRSLGTGDYLRVRVGIGRPPGRQDPADFVLEPFSKGERSELPDLLDRGCDAVRTLVLHGLASAQDRFNADPSS